LIVQLHNVSCLHHLFVNDIRGFVSNDLAESHILID